MGVAALVLGIISLVCSVMGPLGFIGTICGIVGIILGALSNKNTNLDEKNRGYGKTGLILSIIAVALGILFTICCAVCATGLAAAAASGY